MFVLSRWAGGLTGQYGSRGPLILGPIIAAAGFGLLALPGVGGSVLEYVLPALVVLGFGMVITVAPLTTTVMSSVDATRSGVASGINNAVARTAGLIAIAVLGIVVGSVFGHHLRLRLADRPIPAAVRTAVIDQRGKWAGAQVPASIDRRLQLAIRRDIDESFVAAFRAAMLLSAALALLSGASAALLVASRGKGAHGNATVLS